MTIPLISMPPNPQTLPLCPFFHRILTSPTTFGLPTPHALLYYLSTWRHSTLITMSPPPHSWTVVLPQCLSMTISFDNRVSIPDT